MSAVLTYADARYALPGVAATCRVWLNQRQTFPDDVDVIFSEWVGEWAWSVAHWKLHGPSFAYAATGSLSNAAFGARFGGRAMIRFSGGTAIPAGLAASKAATNASMSCAPPSESVPSLKTVNPSPPVARKLFIVTRSESPGRSSVPSTHMRPMRPGQV